MAFEQKEGQAALFPNKKSSDKAPDFTGKGMIGGRMVKLAAWKKTSDKGGFLTLSIKPEEDGGQQHREPPPEYKAKDNWDW